jgi:primosomal protein N' (replication factor Y)
VVTDVAGIDKEFDYLLPEAMTASVGVGTEVRVPLAGRRVGGWVVSFPEHAPEGIELRPVAKVRGHGPEPALVDLAGWAAWRWAGKRSWFLRAASAPHAVVRLPRGEAGAARPPAHPAPPVRTPLALPSGPGGHVLRLAPAADPTPLVAAAAQAGPLLVVVPTTSRAAVLAGRLRRAGADVALLPEEWPKARAGRASVVVGTMSAAWGPCPRLAAAMVLDAHDEGLVAEGAPTWNALAVLAERTRRAGAPLFAVSPCPSLEVLALGSLHLADRGSELAGWALTEVIDRRADDPRLGLWSERLVQAVRSASPENRVACFLNRTGRVRLLACAACGELARCEKCAAAVDAPTAAGVTCPRCGHGRPSVCLRCGSIRLKALRVGVSRAREQLETLTGEPVGEVTAAGADRPTADVMIGTEALLRRLDPASKVGTVAYVDFDQQLLAPRVRAAEEAMALLVLGARLVRGRAGRLLVQTRLPDDPVLRALRAGDPAVALEGQAELRRAMGFPPFGSVAVVGGDAAAGWVSLLSGVAVVGPDADGKWLLKAPTPARLSDALAAPPRPATGTLRVAVDPARI